MTIEPPRQTIRSDPTGLVSDAIGGGRAVMADKVIRAAKVGGGVRDRSAMTKNQPGDTA